jgi:hypothetical protein
MYESRTTKYTALADVDATLNAKIIPGTLAKVVQFLTDEKIPLGDVPPEKMLHLFRSLYGNNPHITFPPEHNV